MDLKDLIKLAKSVSLGSMDGIHDVIRDAEIHAGIIKTFVTTPGGREIARPVDSKENVVSTLESIICQRLPSVLVHHQKKR